MSVHSNNKVFMGYTGRSILKCCIICARSGLPMRLINKACCNLERVLTCNFTLINLQNGRSFIGYIDTTLNAYFIPLKSGPAISFDPVTLLAKLHKTHTIMADKNTGLKEG